MCFFFFFLFFSSSIYAKISPWVSTSVLWGQGGIGVRFFEKDFVLSLNNYFVYDWGVGEITYNEFELSYDTKKYGFGLRYRIEHSNDEFAPYIGFSQSKISFNKFDLLNYYELEQRINPYRSYDYLRGLIHTRIRYGDGELRPYVASVPEGVV